MSAALVHIMAVVHARAPMGRITHAGTTAPHRGTNPQSQAETTAQRAAAAVAATAPADSAARLPTYSALAVYLPAGLPRSAHAMPHQVVLCRPQTLGRSAWHSQCFLWVCYTTHTC